MFVEMLPNARGPIIVDACLRLGYTTVHHAGRARLSRPRPAAAGPELGQSDRKENRKTVDADKFALHALVQPCIAISSLVLGLNMLADGLREISLKD